MELEKFDLEKAKAGRKVVTRSGLPVEILKWDIKNEYPIVSILTEKSGNQYILTTNMNGSNDVNEAYDLFLSPDERYVNLYEGRVGTILYDDLKEAKKIGLLDNDEHPKYLGTYKLVKV